jgi:ABC-type Fe3+-siderophore transport system permease subunit
VGIVITFACSKGMYLTALLALIGLLIAFPKVLLMLYGRFEQMIRHYKYSPVLLLGIAIGFLIGLLLIFTVEPAQAQFFNRTQTWMTGAIPGIDTGLVALIFNVLRALFVIYLGIGLVKVIQSARNDDDWQQMARTPLILVVTVTMGDILAGIITGAA